MDVFEYGPFTSKLRAQIRHILCDCVGNWGYGQYSSPIQNKVWDQVCNLMRKEEGVSALIGRSPDPQAELLTWMSVVDDGDAYLEALELILRVVDNYIRDRQSDFSRVAKQSADSAIKEINARILEAGFGFEYKNDEIIRIDSLFAHREIVIPAIVLTGDPGFVAANTEYMRAHEAYRKADYETCLTECAKAFESVLKVIGAERNWGITEADPASKLVEGAVKAGFLSAYMEAGFNSLRSMLVSGVPTLRNKTAAHGAGTSKRTIPPELAAFQLHQTASVIVFLIESHKAQPL